MNHSRTGFSLALIIGLLASMAHAATPAPKTPAPSPAFEAATAPATCARANNDTHPFPLDGKLTMKDWLSKASDAGDVCAKFALGSILVRGGGLPQDCTRGIILLKEASAACSQEASMALSKIYANGACVTADAKVAKQYEDLKRAQEAINPTHNCHQR